MATAFDFLCLLLVKKKTKFVVSIGHLTPSESYMQRHPVRDFSHCLACTYGWALPSGPLQMSSEFLTRLLPAAHW